MTSDSSIEVKLGHDLIDAGRSGDIERSRQPIDRGDDINREMHAMPQARSPGAALGITISVLLHALLILGFRVAIPSGPPPGMPVHPMTVWLIPAPHVPMMSPAITHPPAVALLTQPMKSLSKEPNPQGFRKLSKEASATHSISPSPEAAPIEPQNIAESSRPRQPVDPFHADQEPKKFDMDAALKTARKVASEPDPARAGLPVAQLEKMPLYPESHETQLSRDIKGATRPDCRISVAGLLSPLVWLTDKKDSGCKW